MSKKYFIYVVISLAALFSVSIQGCSNKDERLETNAFKSLRPKLLNPDTYSLISIEPVDSLTEYENILNTIMLHEYLQEETLQSIRDLLSKRKKYDEYDNLDLVDSYFIDLTTDSTMLAYLEDRISTADQVHIRAIKYVYRFMAMNKDGQTCPHMYYMWADTNDNIIQIAEDEKSLSSSPIPIYGYEEKLQTTIHNAELRKWGLE